MQQHNRESLQLKCPPACCIWYPCACRSVCPSVCPWVWTDLADTAHFVMGHNDATNHFNDLHQFNRSAKLLATLCASKLSARLALINCLVKSVYLISDCSRGFQQVHACGTQTACNIISCTIKRHDIWIVTEEEWYNDHHSGKTLADRCGSFVMPLYPSFPSFGVQACKVMYSGVSKNAILPVPEVCCTHLQKSISIFVAFCFEF